MIVHDNEKYGHDHSKRNVALAETSRLATDFKHMICVHCNATFTSKKSLDYHVVTKHPDFISSITSKLHECTKCSFKTVQKYKSIIFRKQRQVINKAVDNKPFCCYVCNYTAFSKHHLIDHMIVHDNEKNGPDYSKRNGWNSNIRITHKTVNSGACSHCDASFRDKRALDDHVLKKHPSFISSITSKIHRCPECHYETVRKISLDDHVVRKHPDYISSVTHKLHECTKCTFKTVKKYYFDKHLLKHPGLASNFKSKICIHCNATFNSKKSLDDHVVRKHPDFISSITNKLHECTKCTFKTVQKICFDKHLLKHPELSSDFKHITCVHCNATFKSKTALDYHVVGKHPDFISSITSKLHECTKCTFKTVKKCFLDKHLLRHSGHASNFKHKTCVHCNATFKSKMALDDHVVRKHPDFISSVTHKLHECTKCTYKTVKKDYFDMHLLKHPGLASDFKHVPCIHCNATFMSKTALDYHVVGKHPDFISSITSKLYECTKCSYKTVKKCFLDKHLLKHPGLVSNFKHKTCVHCNAKFRSKLSLDDHIVRKHPDFMSSITSKLHECTICTFKTVRKCSFGRHLLKHPELASDFKHIACVHCNATFKSKTSLDDHVVRKHPDFISSITSKLHECTKCPFKAVKKYFFDKHLLKHSGLASNFKQRTCVHCNVTFKSKIALDDHVLRKHPDFISSVTSKLHECTQCTFKTVRKDYFDMHLLKHPGLASDFKHSTCVHCHATFMSKKSLDDHVVRKTS
nr:unnamed protein product [Callosobruchus analis]